MNENSEAERHFLRHVLATLAYRGGKALRDAPPSFASFKAGETSRTPLEILVHVGDLFDWACFLATGQNTRRNVPPGSWDEEVARFFAGLQRLDAALASNAVRDVPAERLFQGPIADALTHVGQLAMLRRMAGAPVKGENYFEAEIQAGRVGPEQSQAQSEFD
ncbi:MAG: hypothetical protein WAM82_06560 [Thermoanaerobaculia bacterium]